MPYFSAMLQAPLFGNLGFHGYLFFLLCFLLS